MFIAYYLFLFFVSLLECVIVMEEDEEDVFISSSDSFQESSNQSESNILVINNVHRTSKNESAQIHSDSFTKPKTQLKIFGSKSIGQTLKSSGPVTKKKKPAKTAAGVARKQQAKKAVIDKKTEPEQEGEDDDEHVVIPIPDSEDDDDDEVEVTKEMEWIYAEDEKKLPIESIDNIDFVQTRDKKIDTTSTDDSNVTMIRVYRKNHIKHIPMFRFTNESEDSVHEYDEYPLTCDEACIKCGEKFPGFVPVHPPIGFDKKRNAFIFKIFPTCGSMCGKNDIISEKRKNMAEQLGLFGRLMREYFGVHEPITCIPLCARKKFSKMGWMNEDEWAQASGRKTAVIKQPPSLFVETWMEEVDIEAREKERHKHIFSTHSNKATEEQQENYRLNIERVLKEFKSKKVSIQDSCIGKKLGIVVKKSKNNNNK